MKWPAPIFAYRDRIESLGWHRWYAWYPVRVGTEWHWLQYVERKVFYVQGWRITHYQKVS